ncbi:DUF5345 family protein [Clostridium sp. YIM B02515]|uniref:DUF5345 family protein n=1 Tax=Clostridium rhizosphaerae TaxID=2803861 RepID=A0ABS1T4N9_9CLOT|nr:DUF5345 family protein [Clostridium rhizosphaerae]MBL4934292.1 DUF5345 family protein [Clostridium rhizosphaerae]
MKKDIIENNIIDNYYKEASYSEHLTSETDELFNKKLNNSLEKMDIVDSLDFPMDINILEVINNAEAIKAKKKLRKEYLIFISICLVIVSSFIFLAFNVDIKIIIYAEVAISVFLPLTLIPIAARVKLKGVQR